MANQQAAGQERIFPNDAVSMGAVKAYIYNHMLPTMPSYSDRSKAIREVFAEFGNLLFRKEDIASLWQFEGDERDTVFNAKVDLEGIDLWVLNKHIAFFVLRTKMNIDDSSTLSDISSRYNRVMRDFRGVYVNEEKRLFSNNASKGIKLVEWLLKLVTPQGEETNLIGNTQAMCEMDEFYPIHNSAHYAKMITALHIEESGFYGEEIEDTYTEELLYAQINGTGILEEVPYHLASTGELYPCKMWENNESYINEQVNIHGINIWKYWSGIAMHDSMAFFSIGEGGSGIVNHARHSYYFIYMLNFYINYTLRYFEHRLIDKEFTSIENIYPMFIEMQRLRNQFMSAEIATKFQPNIVHNAISSAMKTEEIYGEIKENVDATLALTRQNTDMMVTAAMSLFTFGGLWVSQEKLIELFKQHPWWSASAALFVFVVVLVAIAKRSQLVRWGKKLRRKVYRMIQPKI